MITNNTTKTYNISAKLIRQKVFGLQSREVLTYTICTVCLQFVHKILRFFCEYCTEAALFFVESTEFSQSVTKRLQNRQYYAIMIGGRILLCAKFYRRFLWKNHFV